MDTRNWKHLNLTRFCRSATISDGIGNIGIDSFYLLAKLDHLSLTRCPFKLIYFYFQWLIFSSISGYTAVVSLRGVILWKRKKRKKNGSIEGRSSHENAETYGNDTRVKLKANAVGARIITAKTEMTPPLLVTYDEDRSPTPLPRDPLEQRFFPWILSQSSQGQFAFST